MTMRKLEIYSGMIIILLGIVWFALMTWAMTLPGGGVYVLRHGGSVHSGEFLWQTFAVLVGVWAVFMGMLVLKEGRNTKKDL
ncbi:MAG: hypothetical protein Q7R91_02180 [bacterium]|nr:hypothetical protein [bacterium]